jgi:hypothetical protein
MPRHRHRPSSSALHASVFEIAIGLLLALLFYVLISTSIGMEAPLDRTDHLPPQRSTYWD